VTREAFRREGLDAAWERVVAVVVQPGVEFGDDFVLPYDPAAAADLSRFIETRPFVYEAHSTDYQTPAALRQLVRDHFAILKVGPGLTFAFREAVFALAMMEKELLPEAEQSHIIETLEVVMLAKPDYWRKYYRGDERELAFKRKYSFSDRIRYYWPEPAVQQAFDCLLSNLTQRAIPLTLLSQFLPEQYEQVRAGRRSALPQALILNKVEAVLEMYERAC
jgi:D-tagatose-1,6-bisphosphate aldolase subunit GatZ/KbaZ